MSLGTFRSSPLDLAVDTITSDDIEELIGWLKNYPRLTMADENLRFEKAWAKWLGVKYAVLCNSGSSANLLMYAALDTAKRAGKKRVVVPATGWVTTLTPAIQLNYQPLMCESDSRTFGINMEYLEAILKKEKPETVVLVHVLGVPVDLDALIALQKKYGFEFLEDCCASHGSQHGGKKVGTFGLMSSFSFYYGHHMSTIEGGVVCTNDEELYYHLIMLRSHGWCKDLPQKKYDEYIKKYSIDTFHTPFTFIYPGYNLRSTDLNAYIGQMQLKRLDDVIRTRINNHQLYQQMLKGKLDFAAGMEGDVISSISFCAVAKDREHRRKIVRALEEKKIDTRIFTAGNLGKHPFWYERYGVFSSPIADRLYEGGFFLPNNQSLGQSQIKSICETVIKAL